MTRIFWSLLAVFSLNTVFLQAATVSWSQDNVLLQEAVGTGSFGLTLSAASSNNLTVSYAVTNGTAIAGGLDIDLPTSGTVVIGAGNTTASLSFGVIADNVIETLLETLSVKLTAISGNTDYTVGSTNTLTLSIQDDDSTGNLEVLWGWDSRTNYESDLVSAIPVFLSRASSATVSVKVASTGSVNISDYGSPTTTLTFAPGVTKAYYYPAFINDSVVESTETMVLTLNNASGANINSGHTTFTYTILDDDDTPTLEIITGSGVVTEGNSAYVYFRLSHPISQNVTFYASSADGTASSGNDFTFTSGNMTIYAGSLETYAYVTIPRDGLAEGNETFQINISTPSNASLGSSTSAQLTILDKVPEVYAYFPQTSRSEHEGSVTLYVSIYDGVASKDNIVVYLSPSGNATAGSDYTLATNVTIPAGSVYTTLSIPLIDDSVVESDETLTINLTSAANANIRANYPVPTLTILDNDTTPLVSLTTYYSSITEGSSVLPIVYLSLNRYYSGNVVTQISYSGNATLGTDYTLSAGNTTVIVPANSFSSSYVYLTPIDDVTNEGNEIITVDLTSAANATLTSSNTTNINLIDNDNGSQEAVLKLYSSSLSIKEADSTVSYFRVYLNQPSSNNITYIIGSVGGNATLRISIPSTPGIP